MFFPNHNDIATSEDKTLLLELAQRGIESVQPKNFMRDAVSVVDEVITFQGKTYDLKDKRIFVIGTGKASAAMAKELEDILGTVRIHAGVVVSNDKKIQLNKISLHNGSHPLPSEQSVEGAKKILALKQEHDMNENDLLISLISGGGSSLTAYPEEGVSLEEKQQTIDTMISAGLSVHDMTVVKRKLSRIKGGKLGHHFSPTPTISIVLSDVVGDNQEVIASGPFAKDESTYADAYNILVQFGIQNKVPQSVIDFLKRNISSEQDGTTLDHVRQHVVANNDSALTRIEALARERGIGVVVSSGIQGEAQAVAEKMCMDVLNTEISKPTLFLFGGETTVTLSDNPGKGGRNQEFVLSCLNAMKGSKIDHAWAIASVGTDGTDFVSESAGGIIDNSTVEQVTKTGVDLKSYLDANDSHTILKKLQSNIAGLHTGTNVCDIMMFLISPQEDMNNEKLTVGEVREYWGKKNIPQQWYSKKEPFTLAWFNELSEKRYKRYYEYFKDLAEFEYHPGEQVLEVGCGLGTDLLEYAKGGAIVTGVDLGPDQIMLTKLNFDLHNIPYKEIKEGNAENLPFPDNSFDLVVSIGVIHHTPDTEKAISEIYRVLKDDGKAIVLVYARGWKHYIKRCFITGILKGRWFANGFNWQKVYNEASEVHGNTPKTAVYTKRQVKRLFKAFGDVEMQKKRLGEFFEYKPYRTYILPALFRNFCYFFNLERLLGENWFIKAQKPEAPQEAKLVDVIFKHY